MYEWMSRYVDAIGMSPASVVTTVFGAFCVAFVVIICWGKLVEDFGPAGGFIAGAIIIGTFWVMNHKLPGFGINPEGIPHPDGGSKQFGLIYQGFRGAARGPTWAPRWAWACGFAALRDAEGRAAPVGDRVRSRLTAAIAGGIVGGVIVGLVGWTGANLFGYK